nr:aa3-type cytochrome c oxidase subunit IV [Aerococcus urinae]
MDAGDHIATYEGFITGAKWGIGFLVVLLAGMAYFLL